MFILRTITFEGNQVNICLGTNYNFVPREVNPKEFYRTYKTYIGKDVDEEITEQFKDSVFNDVYAFIVHDDGKHIIPLFKEQFNYIMVSDGKTFSNLTFK